MLRTNRVSYLLSFSFLYFKDVFLNYKTNIVNQSMVSAVSCLIINLGSTVFLKGFYYCMVHETMYVSIK